METTFQNVCEVTIESVGKGILLHNPAGMMTRGDKKEKNLLLKNIPDAEEEAEKSCYWTEDKKSLGFPGDNIRACLIRAASGAKVPGNKKMSLIPIISGDMEIVEDMVPFNTKKYDIDVRRAVVQRQGIPRARALIKTWKLTFHVGWDSGYLGMEFYKTLLPDLLERAGHQIGLGDYRPEKKGPFGRFKVVGIKVLKS